MGDDMRIRTTIIAAASAALFALGGAGVAQADESDVVVDHTTASGAYVIAADFDWWGAHYFEAGYFDYENTHVEIG